MLDPWFPQSFPNRSQRNKFTNSNLSRYHQHQKQQWQPHRKVLLETLACFLKRFGTWFGKILLLSEALTLTRLNFYLEIQSKIHRTTRPFFGPQMNWRAKSCHTWVKRRSSIFVSMAIGNSRSLFPIVMEPDGNMVVMGAIFCSLSTSLPTNDWKATRSKLSSLMSPIQDSIYVFGRGFGASWMFSHSLKAYHKSRFILLRSFSRKGNFKMVLRRCPAKSH
jgi:hypothetical protein